MSRIFLAILLLTVFGFSEEKTYVFKAKGEFAKELKQLLKKHEKEGKIEIQEEKPDYYNNSGYNNQRSSLLDSFLNSDDLSGDINFGKRLYDRTCYRCHGKLADKSYYPNARVLNTLTKKELYNSLFYYKTDSQYGDTTRMIMRQQAKTMTTREMASVSAYIYSLSHSKKEALSPLNEKEDEVGNKQGVQGTYLK